MRRGSLDAQGIAVVFALALVGAAVVAAWVIANWEAIVFWTSTALVAALFVLAVYLMAKGGAIRR